MAMLAPHHNAVTSMTFSIVFTPLTTSIKPPRLSLFSTLPFAQACSKPHLGRDLWENLRTLYLFTKSDFKTILLPVTVFACIMAPINRVQCLPRILFWIWLHLLQFCVSNQCINPNEDAVNKPWRPIPAGRVTLPQAQNLRRVLVASCLILSIYRDVLPASILICLSTIAYNDLGFHAHLMLRNVCNAVGYASFELGATQLAGMTDFIILAYLVSCSSQGRRAADCSVASSSVLALVASSLIVLTTIHAADFRDEMGDRLEGKKTLPISFPEASRIFMLASLVLWSTVLGFFWNIDIILASVLLVMGAMVGYRFMYQRDTAADRKSYLLYNIWLSLAHICLGVGQYQGRTITTFPMMNSP